MVRPSYRVSFTDDKWEKAKAEALRLDRLFREFRRSKGRKENHGYERRGEVKSAQHAQMNVKRRVLGLQQRMPK